MATLAQTTLAIGVVVFLSGCSGYNKAVLPPSSVALRDNSSGMRYAEVGENAHIVLNSGRAVVGVIESLSPDTITIRRTGNYGEETVSIRKTEIEKLEVGDGASLGSAATGVGIVVLGALVYAVIFFRPAGN